MKSNNLVTWETYKIRNGISEHKPISDLSNDGFIKLPNGIKKSIEKGVTPRRKIAGMINLDEYELVVYFDGDRWQPGSTLTIWVKPKSPHQLSEACA